MSRPKKVIFPSGHGFHSHHIIGSGALSRARLSYQPKGLSSCQIEVYAVYGFYESVVRSPDREVFFQSLDSQYFLSYFLYSCPWNFSLFRIALAFVEIARYVMFRRRLKHRRLSLVAAA